MRLHLQGKGAIVAGSRGVGNAIALAFAWAGSHLAAAARTLPEVKAAAGVGPGAGGSYAEGRYGKEAMVACSLAPVPPLPDRAWARSPGLASCVAMALRGG
jgi:NAD(P)-dependent dehydrogenase (short-subunit alcohol dehydrogenase family)